eukprot:s2547_g16.t1
MVSPDSSLAGPSDEDLMDKTRKKIQAIDEKIKEAATRVTLEEVEPYWKALPPTVKELVTKDGEVVPISSLSSQMMMRGERSSYDHGRPIGGGGTEWQREERESPGGVFEGQGGQAQGTGYSAPRSEAPTKSWLESCSGAVAPRKRRRCATDAGLADEVVEEIKNREQRKWEKEAAQAVEILQKNIDLPIPIVKGAEGSLMPDECYKSIVGACTSSTLRKRTREWRKYVKWLETVHRVRWKRTRMLDYFTELRLTGAPFILCRMAILRDDVVVLRMSCSHP